MLATTTPREYAAPHGAERRQEEQGQEQQHRPYGMPAVAVACTAWWRPAVPVRAASEEANVWLVVSKECPGPSDRGI